MGSWHSRFRRVHAASWRLELNRRRNPARLVSLDDPLMTIEKAPQVTSASRNLEPLFRLAVINLAKLSSADVPTGPIHLRNY
jgi:hypothetical protein